MQDATPPTPPTPPADPAGQVPWEPFGPQQIMQVMNAAVHLCQASAAFMQRGLYVAVVAIPAGRRPFRRALGFEALGWWRFRPPPPARRP